LRAAGPPERPAVAAGPVVGIVAAAGSGERLGRGGPKALVDCACRPLLEWSLAPLAAVCDTVVVALPPGVEPGAFERVGSVTGVTGGDVRSESVLRAARAAPEARAFVVHDAARPLLTRDLVERCLAGLEPDWDGAVAAAPMTDTVKEAAADGAVLRTLDRAALWSVQTPQAFRARALLDALDCAGPDGLAAATDDASLVEAAGGRVRVVEAPPENVKVTRASDLAAVEAVLAGRRDEP
jgi:2-C-methyl-D-erythritol 4-phosphate cytidylyltransferase